MVDKLVAEWVEEMAEWRDDKKAGERAERKVLMKVFRMAADLVVSMVVKSAEGTVG